MTVSSSTSKVIGAGNGATTNWPFAFKVLNSGDLEVTYTDTSGVETALSGGDYAVSLNANQTVSPGGSILYPMSGPAIATGTKLTIRRVMQFVQLTDLKNQGGFYPEVLETALDRLTMLEQQLNELMGRTVRGAVSDAALTTLPPVAQRASKALGFDAGGNPIAMPPGSIGSADGISFLQSGAGAQTRTVQDKLRDFAGTKDFATIGDGVAEDGPKIAAMVAAHNGPYFSPGTYRNATTAITLPFTRTAFFQPGADIVNSGPGSFTASGVAVRWGYNPSNLSGWTGGTPANTNKFNYEGLAVDLGGYGPRAFGVGNPYSGHFAQPSAIAGAVEVPANATIYGAGLGVAGYARNKSTDQTGTSAIFWDSENGGADGCNIWGGSGITTDRGIRTNVWGIENDINVYAVTSNVYGYQAIGASTVEPAFAIAYNVDALGFAENPKKRWSHAFKSNDGAAVTGLEIGSVNWDTQSTAQPIKGFYRNAAHARSLAYQLRTDNTGNVILEASDNDKILLLQAYTGGVAQNNIKVIGGNVGIGLGSVPAFPLEVGGNARFNANLSVTGAGGNIAGDVYTPVATIIANLSTVTPSECTWTRNQNVVRVAGKFIADPIAGALTLTRFRIPLPVASDFGFDHQCAGILHAQATLDAGVIVADPTNNAAEFYWFANGAAADAYFFEFQYKVI